METETKTKPKRKYTKKVKNPPQAPTPQNSPEPIEPIPIRDIEDILKEVYDIPYRDIAVYIYYEGDAKIDMLAYIKIFQVLLDANKLGSQIQIVTTNGIEKVGLKNCYSCQEPAKKWTDFIMVTTPVLAIKIKELPRISAKELYDLILKETEYNDNFFEIKEI